MVCCYSGYLHDMLPVSYLIPFQLPNNPVARAPCRTVSCIALVYVPWFIQYFIRSAQYMHNMNKVVSWAMLLAISCYLS